MDSSTVLTCERCRRPGVNGTLYQMQLDGVDRLCCIRCIFKNRARCRDNTVRVQSGRHCPQGGVSLAVDLENSSDLHHAVSSFALGRPFQREAIENGEPSLSQISDSDSTVSFCWTRRVVPSYQRMFRQVFSHRAFHGSCAFPVDDPHPMQSGHGCVVQIFVQLWQRRSNLHLPQVDLG